MKANEWIFGERKGEKRAFVFQTFRFIKTETWKCLQIKFKIDAIRRIELL